MLKYSLRRGIFLQVLLIIILGCMVYGNTLKGKFIYDDITLIKYNNYTKNWASVPKILIEDIGAGSGQISTFNRPIQMLTYIMDYSFWGLNESGYHITNIILHILVSICVYFLASILCGSRVVALLVGLLYLAHPIHTEAVAYISGRADPLATLFILLCMLLYIKQTASNSTARFISILVCYTAALFSKEYSIITPVLFLLYSYIFKEKLRLKEFLSLLTITAVYLIMKMATLKHIPTAVPPGFFQRVPGFFLAITEYTRLLFLPFDLHMVYGKKTFNFNDLRVISGIIITLCLLGYAFKKRNKNSLASFSILWFFISILPQANLIYPINAFMAEHWLYLPSVGFFLILAQGLIFLYRRIRIKNIAFALIVGVLFFYSYLTIKQNYYWREPISFYERTLKFAPGNGELLYNLALNYENNGNDPDAISLYRKVLAINPRNANAYFHLANIYHALGRGEEVARLYKEAIATNPDSAFLYYWFGNFYNETGKTKEAIELYNKAIDKDSNFALVYINLGKLYNNSGDKEKALAMFGKAIALFTQVIEIEPDYAIAHSNLAEAYYYTGQYDLAIKHYNEAIKRGYKIDPKFLRLLQTPKDK